MIQALSATTGMNGFNTINMRCPRCRREGAFHGLAGTQDSGWSQNEGDGLNGAMKGHAYRVGVRQCPNAECKAVVFFTQRDQTRTTYPPEVLDFDATALPSKILQSLEEAVKCHAAGCYSASALMVRKTLENLCEDKQATGANLKARIANLRTTIVISDDLLEAADELRLLGNDAAHVEAQAYDAIEAEEVEVAVELTKELLKAVYQHTSLVARLRALKTPAATP